MGLPLPKPVLTQIQERTGNDIFRCGASCVNGYRDGMEDAHLVYMHENWGFFAVFDGHVNDSCSTYLEQAWRDVLDAEKDNMPMSDERLRELALKIDQDWMDSGREGGSTGTFFVARKDHDQVHLQVGNVGDSRVIACIDGVCKPMTEDHKPNNDGERQRIENCGGRVENNRVDGNLAVSRAFGDRDYKMSTSGQLQQKVIALADVTHATLRFDGSDFAILCCDGVFEGNFSNEQVIDYIKEQLTTSNDLAEIAGRVCDEAIQRGSRDNISCMIVQFTSGADYSAGPHTTIVPGPFSAPRSINFRKAYEMMADKGNTTVGALLEERYRTLAAMTARSPAEEEEYAVFKDGPGSELTHEERVHWFTDFFNQLCESANNASDQYDSIQFIQQQVGVPLPMLLSLMNDPKEQK